MAAVLVNLLVIFFIVYVVTLGIKKEPLRAFFLPGLILKFVAGIAVGLIYSFYYDGGDTFNYFYDAVIFSEIGVSSPYQYFQILVQADVPYGLSDHLRYSGQPRAIFMAKILSIFTLITRNDYWLSGMYLSLFSFCGMWYLANRLTKTYPATRFAAVVAFLAWPSVLVWSSGVMKESIIMGALCFLAGFILSWQVSFNYKEMFRNLPWILILLILLWKLKYYYLAVFVPIAMAMVLSLWVYEKNSSIQSNPKSLILIWLIGFLILGLIATTLYPTLHLSNIFFFILDSHDEIYKNSRAENLIHFDSLKPELGSFLRNFPLALFSGLYRPGIWEAEALFQLGVGLENLVILLLSVSALINQNKIEKTENKVIVSSLIIYIILLAPLMAFASPNFGTLMRYKVGFLPFLIYLSSIKNPLINLLTTRHNN